MILPLDEGWRASLSEIARARGLPFGLGASALVRELSDAYNEGRPERVPPERALAARLAFFFARDVPKAAAAVRELAGAGLLALRPDAPLRVLDVGAGLGAATWGAVRALAGQGTVEAKLVDRDAGALEVARAIHRARSGREGGASVVLETTCADVASLPRGEHDLVLASSVLAELGGAVSVDADRVEQWLARVAPSGSLAIVEPALRARTRHLHAVRDELVRRGAAVFAPCLFAGPCPMLERETDWCHEDLPVDLPEWLAPVAREAGLRWEGLTFSYLVLRRDGRTLAGCAAGAERVVSRLVRTKGKLEARVCGPRGERAVRRLDRDASATNRVFEELERGDLVELPEGADRVAAAAAVRRVAWQVARAPRGRG